MPKIHPDNFDERAERLVKSGERIRAARVSAGFELQADFAQAVGVSTGTVSSWESGNHGIGGANLARVVEITWASSSYLLLEHLAKKNTLERRARELGTILRLRRIEALLALPERHLLKEIDAIIGSSISEPKIRRSRGE